MEDVLQRLADVVADPYSAVAAAKERLGKKVIACFPMYIPEEIIHAAGLLPVMAWESNEPVTWGLSRILSSNCAMVRSLVDDILKGKLDFLDGMVFYDICMQARGLPYTIGRNSRLPYIEVIHLPLRFLNSPSKDFLVENLTVLKESLEKLTGQKLTSEALNQSIATYNANRGMLRRLYELRREKPGLLKAREMAWLVWSSMLMLKEEHNKLLEEFLPLVEERQASAERGVRVVLCGTNCFAPRADILDLIEEQGMVVMDDDFFVGPRYFANDAEVGANPIEALAERLFMGTPPCPTKVDWETNWGDYIIDMTKRNAARGAIILLVKFCPPLMTYYPDIRRQLDEAGIPHLMLELEHEQVSLESVKTRVRAFAEILSGR